MKKLSVILALLMSLLFGVTAFAANAHYVGTPKATIDNNGNLVVSVKQAGLGAGQTVTFTVTADATVTYAAVNKGGKYPQATNKRTVQGPVNGFVTLTADRNGNITGQITVYAPPVPADFKVSPGQKMVVVDATYTGVTLTDDNLNTNMDLGTIYRLITAVK